MADIQQVSFGQTLRNVMASPARLALIAAASAVLSLVVPVATLSGGMDASIGETGADLAGVPGWCAAIAFVAAGIARFAPALVPYRNVIDTTALGLLAVALLWGFAAGPVSSQLRQANRTLAAFGYGASPGGLHAATGFSITPSVGTLFVLLAPAALLAARRRGQTATMR